MAITTISQLPSLNTSLSKVGRTSVAAALKESSSNSTKETGIVINKTDLLEITLRGSMNSYAYFSSNISIAELHANLFGKIQSINYYNNDSKISTKELSPLSYNESSYYKNGDRIFYLANQNAPLRILRFVGSDTQTLDHNPPKEDSIIDYVATPNVTNVGGESFNTTYETSSQWMYDNNILDFNLIPLFAPLYTSNKLYNCYWIEASNEFNAYYSKVYTGLGKILHSIAYERYLKLKKDEKLNDYEINEDNFSILNQNDTNKKLYLPSTIIENTVLANSIENYNNLNVVIYKGTANAAACWLHSCYENNNISASNLNFWTLIYSENNSSDVVPNLIEAIPAFVFIPPRVFNDTKLTYNTTTNFLYFYCGNSYTNNEDGINLDNVIDLLNKKENKLISNTLSIFNDSSKNNYTRIELNILANSSTSPIYSNNNNELSLRIDPAVLSLQQDINNNTYLSISTELSTYIVYTRKLITNSVEQINNILNDPSKFDAKQLTTASLTNS